MKYEPTGTILPDHRYSAMQGSQTEKSSYINDENLLNKYHFLICLCEIMGRCKENAFDMTFSTTTLKQLLSLNYSVSKFLTNPFISLHHLIFQDLCCSEYSNFKNITSKICSFIRFFQKY